MQVNPVLWIVSMTLALQQQRRCIMITLDCRGWEEEEDGALGLRTSHWPQGLKQQRMRWSRTMGGPRQCAQVVFEARRKLLRTNNRIFTTEYQYCIGKMKRKWENVCFPIFSSIFWVQDKSWWEIKSMWKNPSISLKHDAKCSIYDSTFIHRRRHVKCWLVGIGFHKQSLWCLSFIWPLTWQCGCKYSSHCLQRCRDQTSRVADLMSCKPDGGMHGWVQKVKEWRYWRITLGVFNLDFPSVRGSQKSFQDY